MKVNIEEVFQFLGEEVVKVRLLERENERLRQLLEAKDEQERPEAADEPRDA